MQINLDIKVPSGLFGYEKEERIKFDLEKTISVVINAIPESERKNIKVKDGDSIFHRYESFEQIEEIYKRDGKLGILYVGADHHFEK